MTSAVRLLFFAGSHRTGSHNMRLAKLGATIAEANGIAATFADLGDYPMPLYNGDLEAGEGVPENAHKFASLMALHSGIFISCPEYNASITPLLKNTMDWVSRVSDDDGKRMNVCKTRVFALGAASPGGTGGMRGLFMVRHMLVHGLGALVLPEQFLLPRAPGAYDDHGHLDDKDAQTRFKTQIEVLSRAARVLHG